MAGHSKWHQIKHKKGKEDAARARVFSKLANAISAAAKSEPNPDFNPTLRSAIERAKKESMPAENIERAIKRATEAGNLEEIFIESYGPEGAAIIIEGLTQNKPRSINEIKILMGEHDIKLAAPGSVKWSFAKTEDGFTPNFKTDISQDAKDKITKFIEAAEEREDINSVYANI
ncbi:MAG: YebC/PmpR family DNA-binding transcriptional regulator [Candidatus Colwellbacteria bacterium]|nr:YebC/PmpR family DNA-binding transcriptional regulator [Candidatus Colwellbacteria bacterium]